MTLALELYAAALFGVGCGWFVRGWINDMPRGPRYRS